MDMFYYKLFGKDYPARTIKTDRECFIISTEELNENLFDEKGQYISDEAKNIDKEIIFFVPDEIINSSDEEINDFLENNL